MSVSFGMMTIPEEEEINSFFVSKPSERQPNDGFWAYWFHGTNGISLRFSFDALERSVQTLITYNGHHIATICHEEATSITIHGGKLYATCGENPVINLELSLDPLEVNWYSLAVDR